MNVIVLLLLLTNIAIIAEVNEIQHNKATWRLWIATILNIFISYYATIAKPF